MRSKVLRLSTLLESRDAPAARQPHPPSDRDTGTAWEALKMASKTPATNAISEKGRQLRVLRRLQWQAIFAACI